MGGTTLGYLRRSLAKLLGASVFLFSLLATQVEAEDAPEGASEVLKSPRPAWVLEKVIDPTKECPHNGVSGGVWYLCSDTQVHVERETRFAHFAYRFLNTKGISNNSQFSVNFDPRYQTLKLHSLVIYRDGEASDRLREVEVKLLNQEEGLEQQLYDGSVSAHLILKDIQVGDVLEYSYSVSGRNPVFGEHYSSFQNLAFNVPIDFLFQRYIWDPKKRKISTRLFFTEKEPTLEERDGLKELIWEEHEVEGRSYESSTPSWYYNRPMLQLTDFSSWEDFGEWIAELYPMDQELPAEVQGVCDDLKKLPTESEQIVGALRYVQDKVRYLGSFMGAHTHKPYPLEVICERKFGDCKDKSSLLSAMLRSLGYEATVALVNTSDRQTIGGYLPSQYDFDHAIVHLRLDGEDYWLDGTYSYQRGHLEQLYVPHYEYAFIIEEGAKGLTRVAHPDLKAHQISVTERYEIPGLKGEVLLESETVATGCEARYLRSYFSSTSNEDVKKNYITFYASYYPKIEALEVSFEDDEEENRFVVKERYRIADFWTSADEDPASLSASVIASSIHSSYSYPDSPMRKMPYAIGRPRSLKHVVEITTPRDWNLSPIEEFISNDFFDFEVESEAGVGVITLNYRFIRKKDAVDAASIESYIADCQKLSSPLDYNFNFTGGDGGDSVETSEEEASGAVAWKMLLFLNLCGALLLGTIVSVALYFYDPDPKPSGGDPALKGLSGWMTLVVLGVVVTPIYFLINLVSDAELYNGIDLWTLSEAGDYVRIGLIFFIIANSGLMLPYMILMNVLLFKKRSSFPRCYFMLLVVTMVFDISTYILGLNIEGFDSDFLAEYLTDGIKDGFRLLIWGSYILVSVRVKNTFQSRRHAVASLPPPPTMPPVPPSAVASRPPPVNLSTD